MHLRVATLLGVGYLPGAPGTWASMAAIPLAWALHALGGFWLLALATVGFGAAGYWATARVLEDRGALPGEAVELEWREKDSTFAARRGHDPSEIVIDELVGMMLALWPLSAGLMLTGAAAHVWPWPGWALGFLLFRFFDIVKPPPVSWAERVPGALGVMLDDIVAGALTALVALLAAGVAHGWL